MSENMQSQCTELPDSISSQGREPPCATGPGPSPERIDSNREEILNAYAVVAEIFDKDYEVTFLGEEIAIRQMRNVELKKKDVIGLLIPQTRHGLVPPSTELSPGKASLYNPTTIPEGSEKAWLVETMRICMKHTQTMRDHGRFDEDHPLEVLQAWSHVERVCDNLEKAKGPQKNDTLN